jgi:hypothetical protein
MIQEGTITALGDAGGTAERLRTLLEMILDQLDRGGMLGSHGPTTTHAMNLTEVAQGELRNLLADIDKARDLFPRGAASC